MRELRPSLAAEAQERAGQITRLEDGDRHLRVRVVGWQQVPGSLPTANRGSTAWR